MALQEICICYSFNSVFTALLQCNSYIHSDPQINNNAINEKKSKILSSIVTQYFIKLCFLPEIKCGFLHILISYVLSKKMLSRQYPRSLYFTPAFKGS